MLPSSHCRDPGATQCPESDVFISPGVLYDFVTKLLDDGFMSASLGHKPIGVNPTSCSRGGGGMGGAKTRSALVRPVRVNPLVRMTALTADTEGVRVRCQTLCVPCFRSAVWCNPCNSPEAGTFVILVFQKPGLELSEFK